MVERTAASQIWPNLKTGTPQAVERRREPSTGAAMWPALSQEARAREAWQARWRAEQKAHNKRMADHLQALTEQLQAEKRGR